MCARNEPDLVGLDLIVGAEDRKEADAEEQDQAEDASRARQLAARHARDSPDFVRVEPKAVVCHGPVYRTAAKRYASNAGQRGPGTDSACSGRSAPPWPASGSFVAGSAVVV
jgi:hypothetical protein